MENRDHWRDRLSEYLDGELTERDRAACEAHLAVCPECADDAEGLRAVVAQASLLPPVPPTRDLWPGIEDRLETRTATESTRTAATKVRLFGRPSRSHAVGSRSAGSRGSGRSLWGSRWTLSVPQLAAAAIALVVLTAGAMRMLTQAAGPGSVVQGAGVDQPIQSGQATQSFLAAYAPAISELEREYEARRAGLDPETRRVVEENLAIIDRAIAEAERALNEDPSNPFVTTHLAGAMRQKVDLLRRVTSIPSKES